MAQIVQRPPSWGEALGTGLGSGLQALADLKLQQMKRQQMRQEEFQQKQRYQEMVKPALQKAGLPEEFALLEPSVLSTIFGAKLRGPTWEDALYALVTGRKLFGGLAGEEPLLHGERQPLLEAAKSYLPESLGGESSTGKMAAAPKKKLKNLPDPSKFSEGQKAINPLTKKAEFIIKNGKWEKL